MPNSVHSKRNTGRRKRAVVIARDGSRCVYCNTPLTPNQVHLDHVLPRSKGGTDAQDNLVVACAGCQHWKGDKTVYELGCPDWLLKAVHPTYLAIKRQMIDLAPVYEAGRRGQWPRGEPMRSQRE
jgi:5-methylcytosine-specific restriction endonuclease McrA